MGRKVRIKNLRPKMSQKVDFLHFGQKPISEKIHSVKKIYDVKCVVRIVESFDISIGFPGVREIHYKKTRQKRFSKMFFKTF